MLVLFTASKSNHRFLVIVWMLIFMSLSSVWAKWPVRVVDALDREVIVDKPPKRIITIFSSNTEILTSLGLGRSIVGIDAFTNYPPQIKNKPKIGGRLGFSLDRIIGQEPDLVIMTPARQATHQLLTPLEKLKIPSIVLEARSIDEVIHNITLIAKVTGTEQQGNKVVSQMKQRIAKSTLKSKDYHVPRVVMITGKVGNGMLLVTRVNSTRTNGYTADIVLKAGGILSLDEKNYRGPRLTQISPEVLLSNNPDIILFAGSEKDLSELTRLSGWSQMKATKTGFVRTVSRSELLIPGPRVVDGIESLSLIFNEWNQKQ